MFLLQMQLMQCWLMRSKYNRRQTHLAETMVLILYGNYLRKMTRSRAVTNQIFVSTKIYFPS